MANLIQSNFPVECGQNINKSAITNNPKNNIYP